MKFFLILFILAACFSPTASARTWHVEKDGSGDFTVIMFAMDAAASGDTIRIGPGLHDYYYIPDFPGMEREVCAFITQEELTIIGAGQDETVIGQVNPYESSDEYNKVFVGGAAVGNLRLTIQDVCIQNSYQGVLFQGGGHSFFTDCRFVGNATDLALLGDETDISGCTFDPTSNAVSSGRHIWSHHQDQLQVEGCSFRLKEMGRDQHISCYGKSASIVQCEFYQGHSAVATICDSISIRGCLFDGQNELGVVGQGGSILLEDCVFRNQFIALHQNMGSGVVWAARHLVIEDASYASLFYISNLEGYITDSILAKGSEFVVGSINSDKSQNTVNTFNMTNNWWGTADPDTIQAWIYDWNDNNLLGTVIDWEPFNSQSVAVEKQSLGGIRAMFK